MTIRRKSIVGHVDCLTRTHIIGWAVNTIDIAIRISVSVQIRGEVIGSGDAVVRRNDLVAAGYGNGCHGFHFPIEGSNLRSINDVTITANGLPKNSSKLFKSPCARLYLTDIAKRNFLAEYDPNALVREPDLVKLFSAIEAGDQIEFRRNISDSRLLESSAIFSTACFAKIMVAQNKLRR